MPKSFRDFLSTYTGVLFSLILLLVLQSLPDYTVLGGMILNIIFTSVLIFGTMLLVKQKKLLFIVAIFAVPAFLLRWFSYLTGTFTGLMSMSFILDALFLIPICLYILKDVLAAKQITFDTLAGAISVYLLIGFIFMNLYALIDINAPGSIKFPTEKDRQDIKALSTLLYYSFVSLTTLGFGDMVPTTNIARTITVLEAIVGQMYVAILISRLVGVSVSKTKENPIS